MRHDSDVAKSVKRKKGFQTPSKFKASVSNTEKQRKVVHVTSMSEPKNDIAEGPLKAVSVKPHHCDVQAQILRCCMVKELKASNEDAFLMYINGSELSDCEMYVDVFAGYLSLREGISAKEFNDELLRTRYGTLLWDYAKQKIESEAGSDNEAPPKPARPKIDFDQVGKMIVN
ncbi:hypothetical protein RND71_022986 [Anisodus tanguticus]|uniref:Uncharacterized protein n=1 Tax=Anisodus tanguticus TaxID=243964 RepID=A0AAE1RT34_9SOLA|nr:hypothetical protein RND71_022986 [Anisodus tanguticus]